MRRIRDIAHSTSLELATKISGKTKRVRQSGATAPEIPAIVVESFVESLDMTDSPEPQNQATPQSSEQKFLTICGQLAIGALLLLLFFYGICITGVVLKEPDIAFLLGGGRWIVEHGQIPATDPFSYTTHYHPVPYVIEKWLTEVIFYGLESSVGLTGLLLFAGIILTMAFLVIPYRIAHLCGLRGGAAMRLACLGLITSMSHLAVRPEIFSFLFTAIWFEVMIRLTIATTDNTKIRWDFVAILAVLMCLWSNMHTLFMVGVLIPGFYSFCAVVERFLPGVKEKPFNWTAPIITVVCVLSSLFNPYGIGLWTYLPNVFGPFNDTNNEMQPIFPNNAANPLFLGFYILLATGLRDLIRSCRVPLKQGDLFFRGLIPLGILGGMKTVRSIPLCGLFLVSGRARVMEHNAETAAVASQAEESYLARLTNPFKPLWPLTCIATVCIGIYACTYSVIPMVPQDSAAFKPPFKAIEFIEKHRPSGNLLNDPHFGATMIYKMRNNPPVFIDPRYNLYGNELLQNYWHMVNADANYEQLLNHYKIDWVFLQPKAKLLERLAKDPNWQ
ncbi:MAG: hypothetical protein C0469_15235, partial [Cyanobacteria bacterium DS2.3.42]|nr:hypothetical protein [Cyanobacteria bacterium DS2.3.42]